jgi:DNA-binding LacI/PurR family transcriptional regulator
MGLTLVLRFPHSSPESFDRLVRTMHPLAVMTLVRVSDEDRELLHERGVHLIEPPAGQVEAFDIRIGQLQAEHLISRGFTQLAYARVSDARDDIFGWAREAGFRQEAAQHGLSEPVSLNLTLDTEHARQELSRLPASRFGIGCYNDEVAIALLSGARQLGLHVPQDVALVGMDNIPLGALVDPPLTTITADIRMSGPPMAAALRAAVDGNADLQHLTGQPTTLHLVERATT